VGVVLLVPRAARKLSVVATTPLRDGPVKHWTMVMALAVLFVAATVVLFRG
jgi:hypothetical protein